MTDRTSKKYQALRVSLLRRGINLRQWAMQAGYPVGSVYNAVKGIRNGAAAYRIRSELEHYLR